MRRTSALGILDLFFSRKSDLQDTYNYIFRNMYSTAYDFRRYKPIYTMMSIDIVESELVSVLFGGNIPTVILLDYEAYSNGRSKPVKPILLINEKAVDVYSDNELLAIAWHCTFYYTQNNDIQSSTIPRMRMSNMEFLADKYAVEKLQTTEYILGYLQKTKDFFEDINSHTTRIKHLQQRIDKIKNNL